MIDCHSTRLWLVILLFLVSLRPSLGDGPSGQVDLIRCPQGGIQPQIVLDSEQRAHLLYYRGDPRRGDLFYCRQEGGQREFSAPIRVTSDTSTAMAMGSIRGGQLSLGRSNDVFVVWNGGDGSESAAHSGAPLFYSKLREGGNMFTPPRDLITQTAGLDGGGTIAADRFGNVYVLWHGCHAGNTNGEAGRAVYVSRSTDNGSTFSREEPVLGESSGTCACCGMRATTDANGNLFVLFREAKQMTNRAERILVSPRGGSEFRNVLSDDWTTLTCPMSSAHVSQGTERIWAAWETAGQIRFASIDPKNSIASPPKSPSGEGRRKHPVIVENRSGTVLLVWTEGTGWERGGSLAWQLFNREGQPVGELKIAPGIPIWSFAAAYARPDGSFAIIY